MQYTLEVLIEKPIDEVIDLLDSPENKKHWLNGLVSAEHIRGIPGKFGAKMKYNYNFGTHNTSVIETITKENLPHEIHATYAVKGLRNIQENHFVITKEGFTKWISKNDLQPTTFKMNAMITIMPRIFKKETKTNMRNFKNFAENGISIYNPK